MEYNSHDSTNNENLVENNTNEHDAKLEKIVNISNKRIYLVYLVIFFTHVLLNMSNISFSAVVEKIEKDLEIEESQVGFMGTMHYIGQVSGKI